MRFPFRAAARAPHVPDVPAGRKVVAGDNVDLIVQSASAGADGIRRWFDGLKAGGTVVMGLGPQFWTKLYGFVYGKSGMGRQLGLPERS
ncbi:MAG TPA: hypothetical protein VMV90_12020 [Rectinemataceae bacterium]|nr:hypothetical protein [Rectinemataceae bacterium]